MSLYHTSLSGEWCVLFVVALLVIYAGDRWGD